MSSGIEKKVGQLLKEAFPSYNIKAQKVVQYSNVKLSFDFYLPELKLMVEVQGEQHYTYNKFFHKSDQDLQAQKYRDMLKTQYIVENELKLLEIKYDEVSQLDIASIKQLVLETI